MRLQCIPVGAYQTNAYLLEEERHLLVIDPGDGQDALLSAIHRTDLTVDAVVVTHGHIDHFADAAALADAFDAAVYFPREEVSYLDDDLLKSGLYDEEKFQAFRTVLTKRGRLLEDGDSIVWRTHRFTIRIVGGHTDAGMAVCEPEEGMLFSGDILFRGSIGRTDYCRKGEEAFLEGIRQKLFELPETTRVWPGHGPGTTIGDEIRYNPFFEGTEADRGRR